MCKMEVHGYTEFGYIDATINGIRMIIPDTPEDKARWGITEWEEAGNTISAYSPSISHQITTAPSDLFGGPTIGDIFNGN